MSEQTTPVAPTVTWTTTPEDPEVQWSVIGDGEQAPFYAWVGVDETMTVRDSFDYPSATRHENWVWAVESEEGNTLVEGTAKYEDHAKEDAAKALLKALAEHVPEA